MITKKVIEQVSNTDYDEIKEFLKQIDMMLEKKYEFAKVVSVFECWGYEMIKYKDNKIVMYEPFNNITIHLFFKYDINNKRVFSGLRM